MIHQYLNSFNLSITLYNDVMYDNGWLCTHADCNVNNYDIIDFMTL